MSRRQRLTTHAAQTWYSLAQKPRQLIRSRPLTAVSVIIGLWLSCIGFVFYSVALPPTSVLLDRSPIRDGCWGHDILLNHNGYNALTRLALQRAATMSKPKRVPEGHNSTRVLRRVAVFIQVGYPNLWEDMLRCTANVAAAVPDNMSIDVHVAFIAETDDTDKGFSQLNHQYELELSCLRSVQHVTISQFENQGVDVGLFIKQLRDAVVAGRSYDLILKLHTKKDPIWRDRAIESMCGTPEQVTSIWRNFAEDDSIEMMAPPGTTFGPTTPAERIFPHIVNKYDFLTEPGPRAAFDDTTVAEMRRLHHIVFPHRNLSLSDENLVIVAGTIFWATWTGLEPQRLVSTMPSYVKGFTRGYKANLATEHIIERLLPSAILAKGKRIAEVPSAPRMLALYFPQFHRIPENDRFWGDGFTEWTLLRPLKLEGIRKPLSWEAGGLGYYDLMSTEVRRRQAELAREAGLTGFVFYHYWFSGSAAPEHHKVLYKVQEAMLEDGEPDMPFMLSWANEPWERGWTGGAGANSENGEMLLSQTYGSKDEWKDHFTYILRFFEHRNYIKLQGKPVFIIYRIGHIGEKLKPMLQLWRRMAVEAGLPGLHIVHSIGNFYHFDNETAKIEQEANLDAGFHFWPQLLGGKFHPPARSASTRDLAVQVPVQYWGAFTGFDRRPRDQSAVPHFRSVQEFREGLQCSFNSMTYRPARKVDVNFFFLTAWNEWNEQAILEPDSVNRFGNLDAVHNALQAVPARDALDSKPTVPLHPLCKRQSQ